MKNFLFSSALALPLLFLAQTARADGWPQPKGHGFFKLDFTSTRARQFYGLDGKFYDINGAGTVLGNYTAAFYGEYGLSKKLTAIAYVPFVVRNTVNEGVGAITGDVLQQGLQNTAFGDVDLGLRYGLLRKGPWVLSASLTLGLPSGDFRDADLLFTGDGEFNQLLKLEWGHGAGRWYATGHIGANNRSKGFSEEFRYHVEAGYWLVKDKLLASVKLLGVQSFQNGDPSSSTNGLFANNVEYTSPQLGLAYERKSTWGVSVLVGGAVNGRNALAAPAVSVGLYWKMKRDKH